MFDKEKADRVIRFFSELCSHTSGKWAGSPFELTPWQVEAFREYFGRLTPEGKRQYRTLYIEVPKKNGKTEAAAGIALYGLVADGEKAAEVYSAAGDREQASLVFRPASIMVNNNPALKRRLSVIDSRKRIIDYNQNSFYQVLSAETYTKHGINPSCIVFDELHAQPDRRLFDVLIEGTDTAREQQMVVIITTAGIFDKNSIAWEVHEHARQVKAGIVEDPTFLPIIYGAEEDDDWTDPAVWRKANPSLGYIFDIDVIQKHYDAVKNNPIRQNNFRRYRLNQWVSQVTRWMPMDKWDACAGRVTIEELLKRPCYTGIDLSATTDLSAVIHLFPPQDEREKWRTLSKFYIPEGLMRDKERRDGVPYSMWAEAGLITPTPGNVIDYAFIRRDVNEAANLFDVREISYDPWGALKLAVELAEEDGLPMVEFRQGYKSISPPMKELLKLVLSEKLAHGGNPILRWNADNVMAEEDAAENIKPNKAKSTGRIDGIVALIMALGRAIVADDYGSSIYESRGIITL